MTLIKIKNVSCNTYNALAKVFYDRYSNYFGKSRCICRMKMDLILLRYNYRQTRTNCATQWTFENIQEELKALLNRKTNSDEVFVTCLSIFQYFHVQRDGWSIRLKSEAVGRVLEQIKRGVFTVERNRIVRDRILKKENEGDWTNEKKAGLATTLKSLLDVLKSLTRSSTNREREKILLHLALIFFVFFVNLSRIYPSPSAFYTHGAFFLKRRCSVRSGTASEGRRSRYKIVSISRKLYSRLISPTSPRTFLWLDNYSKDPVPWFQVIVFSLLFLNHANVR